MTVEEQKLKAKALRSLAIREHSRFELKQKLARFSENSAQLEQLLDELETQKWLSDARFAAAYLAARAERYEGPRKIRYALRERGVSADIIDNAFIQCGLDWQTCAEKARQKKFGTEPAASWLEQARQNQYLYQRGFDVF